MTGRTAATNRSRLIYLIAGEMSGDAIGGALMKTLAERSAGAIEFAGIGGEAMASQGLRSLFPMEELSIFELHEILAQLPKLLGRLTETERDIRNRMPAALVTIDCPKFSLRVSRRVRDLGIPLIHYVAPTVYAYAPRRADAMAAYLDHLLTLFPFEKPYFDRVNLPSTYVGPHILERPLGPGDGVAFRRKYGLDEDTPIVCVLPGSRRGEIRNMLPVFDHVVRLIGGSVPSVRFVVPVTVRTIEPVSEAAETWPSAPILVQDEDEKRDAMAASNVALTKTGSVTLELAAAGVPTVVAGRVALLSLVQALRGISLKYISLPNWILGRRAVPEFVQLNCKPRLIADAVLGLLTDDDANRRQRADLAEVMERLKVDDRRPSERAADAILGLIEGKPPIAA